VYATTVYEGASALSQKYAQLNAYNNFKGVTEFSADASLNNNLYLHGDASFSGYLYVASDATIHGKAIVDDDVSFNKSLHVATGMYATTVYEGTTQLSQKYAPIATPSFTGKATFQGDASFNTNILVNGDSTLNGNLTVARHATFTGDVSLNSKVTIASDLSVNGYLLANYQPNVIPQAAVQNVSHLKMSWDSDGFVTFSYM
jgi:cytoskeletal protein CcmA (bactofilin family)